MAKLVKPAQFAKETGISRQAVYAKIKRGTLKSKEVDDQLFIVLDDRSSSVQTKEQTRKNIDNGDSNLTTDNGAFAADDVKKGFTSFQTLIDSKNETIDTLNGRIKDLKESNQQLTSVFRGEIDLLKEAFVEMKKLYTGKLQHEQNKEIVFDNIYSDDSISHEETAWIGVKKFLKMHNYDISNKTKVKNYLNFLYSAGDTRIAKINGKIKINEKFCSEHIIKDALSN